MIGFDVYYDGGFIHEESGFDVEEITEVIDYVFDWWGGDAYESDGMKAEDVLIVLYDGEDKEEWTMAELIEEYGA